MCNYKRSIMTEMRIKLRNRRNTCNSSISARGIFFSNSSKYLVKYTAQRQNKMRQGKIISQEPNINN